jgi:flavin reductase (DIM6/NTAB) family NADH-FMN oxidoreductase RutF
MERLIGSDLPQGAAAPAGDLATSFKTAMRRLVASVTIVTGGTSDQRGGFAATSVCSVTIDPPALLVCVNRSASLHDRLAMGSLFCVNLLHGQQGELSSVFGGKVAPAERFNYGAWDRDEDGIAYLSDAQANLFCVVDALMVYGTHSIIVGKVRHVRMHGELAPLVYSDGRLIAI